MVLLLLSSCDLANTPGDSLVLCTRHQYMRPSDVTGHLHRLFWQDLLSWYLDVEASGTTTFERYITHTIKHGIKDVDDHGPNDKI